MDPFEEFEFKPLTDGLGFQRKSPGLRAHTREAQLVQRELDKKIPSPPPDSFFDDQPIAPQLKMDDLLKALEPLPSELGPKVKEDVSRSSQRTGPQLTSTFAKTERRGFSSLQPSPEIPPQRSPSPMSPHFPEPGPAIRDKSFLPASTEIRRGANNDPRFLLAKAPTCFRAAFLDLIMVMALSLLFLVSLLLITGVPLQSIIKNIQVDTTTQVSCALLFLAVMQMYVVISRSFFGRTLGEWTFDFQLGENHEHPRMIYPLKVAWRSLVICLTGIITLPVLSLLFQVDLAAYLSGLQLYRQKNQQS